MTVETGTVGRIRNGDSKGLQGARMLLVFVTLYKDRYRGRSSTSYCL